jgi:hypothetical protein
MADFPITVDPRDVLFEVMDQLPRDHRLTLLEVHELFQSVERTITASHPLWDESHD